MERASPSPPLISVVVPTHNSSQSLNQCLGAIRESEGVRIELIVVDDASQDDSVLIAARYADHVVRLAKTRLRSDVRLAGFAKATGEILVNIDSDVVVSRHTFRTITEYFQSHEQVAAVTGLLSVECPVDGFLSTYKHLYMNYIFKGLPEQVSFLYGSIFALRPTAFECLQNLPKASRTIPSYADDTELGLLLVSGGLKVGFAPQLLVQHLKRFTLLSLLKNDFQTPRCFALLMVRFGLRPQIRGGEPVYLHSSRGQLAGIVCVYGTLLSSLIWSTGPLILTIAWLLVTGPFLLFLGHYRGLSFVGKAILFTWLDHLIMGAGIACGLIEGVCYRAAPKTADRTSCLA
jgi:cellulose synthase/poly-beta-1,6-N-acetylglucosamine synthase-like glycosyltransferase